MIAAATITGKPPADPVLDWAALVEEGRGLLAAMSDGGWTDFNAHDPGITILEAFCYALTDLGYRAGHPVADLIAGAPPLPGPGASLTTRAVTIADMRQAAIDVPGVRNAWIEPSPSAALRLRAAPGSGDIGFDAGRGGAAAADGSAAVSVAGVHRVIIEKSSREDLASGEVMRGVARRLHAERNLGEDFDSFAVLEPQPIAVAADLEIDDAADADAVMLAVFAALDDYCSPEPARRSIAALRAGGATSDAIHDGPRRDGGIADLPGETDRRRVLHLSDVVAALSATPGVRATRRVRIAASPAETGDAAPVAWSLTVADDRVPAFDLGGSRIRLLAGGAVARDAAADPALAASYLDRRRIAAAATGLSDDPPPPAGRDRRTADYRALRHDLPAAFGVRPGALGHAASDARRAAASQLRAYLSMFDVLLAGGFAQLGAAGTLLAGSAGDGRSYVTQLPEDPVAGEDPVLAPRLDAAALQALVEPPGSAAAATRRGRFVAHQLARLGEAAPSGPRPAGRGFAGDTLTVAERRLAAADGFLADHSRLTGGRGSGADLLTAGDESPLADRLRFKLGLPDAARGRLRIVEHVLLRGVADDLDQALPLLAAAGRADPYSLQLSFVLDAALKAAPGDAELIADIVRAECPAHLIACLHWLEPRAFDAFADAYDLWLAALRRARRDALGFEPDAP